MVKEQITQQEVLKYSSEIKSLLFKNSEKEAKYTEIKANSKDGMFHAVARFIETWGKTMQYLINNGDTVADAADKTEYVCDSEGLTGFMFGKAVQLLSEYWIYGDEIKQWHNDKFGYKGKGVVNPSIIKISDEENE